MSICPPSPARIWLDINLAIELKLEFIALSFVREAQDVHTLRGILKASSPDHIIRIIAKIEDQSAVKNLDGNHRKLGWHHGGARRSWHRMPVRGLALIQRQIVSACLARKKRVIVATHMLESMISNPMPTRAEITDVSNAVYEQADAIMLSGETTVGKYPLECVRVMDKIAARVESTGGEGFAKNIKIETTREAIVWGAVQLANQVKAAAIIAFTRHGTMGSLVGAFRPLDCPIYAFTPSKETLLRLTLRWGVTPISLAIHRKPRGNRGGRHQNPARPRS